MSIILSLLFGLSFACAYDIVAYNTYHQTHGYTQNFFGAYHQNVVESGIARDDDIMVNGAPFIVQGINVNTGGVYQGEQIDYVYVSDMPNTQKNTILSDTFGASVTTDMAWSLQSTTLDPTPNTTTNTTTDPTIDPTIHPTMPPTMPTIEPTMPTIHPTMPTIHPTMPTPSPTTRVDRQIATLIELIEVEAHENAKEHSEIITAIGELKPGQKAGGSPVVELYDIVTYFNYKRNYFGVYNEDYFDSGLFNGDDIFINGVRFIVDGYSYVTYNVQPNKFILGTVHVTDTDGIRIDTIFSDVFGENGVTTDMKWSTTDPTQPQDKGAKSIANDKLMNENVHKTVDSSVTSNEPIWEYIVIGCAVFSVLVVVIAGVYRYYYKQQRKIEQEIEVCNTDTKEVKVQSIVCTSDAVNIDC